MYRIHRGNGTITPYYSKVLTFLFDDGYSYDGNNFYLFFIRNSQSYTSTSRFYNKIRFHYSKEAQSPSPWTSSFNNLLTSGNINNFYTLDLQDGSSPYPVCWKYKNYMALFDNSLSDGKCLLAYDNSGTIPDFSSTNIYGEYRFNMGSSDGYYQNYFRRTKVICFL